MEQEFVILRSRRARSSDPRRRRVTHDFPTDRRSQYSKSERAARRVARGKLAADDADERGLRQRGFLARRGDLEFPVFDWGSFGLKVRRQVIKTLRCRFIGGLRKTIAQEVGWDRLIVESGGDGDVFGSEGG